MYNTRPCQEKADLCWEILLVDAKRLLAEAKGKSKRKELRYAVKAFEFLIRQKAPMPGQWQSAKKAGAAKEAIPA